MAGIFEIQTFLATSRLCCHRCHPDMFIFVFLRLSSSHLLLSATYRRIYSYAFFFLVSFVTCLISEFTCFYSFRILFVVLISRVVVLLCSRTRYVTTWFAYLDSFAALVSLCLIVCDHIIRTWYLIGVKKQEGHYVYCWVLLGRKNGLMWRQQQQQQHVGYVVPLCHRQGLVNGGSLFLYQCWMVIFFFFIAVNRFFCSSDRKGSLLLQVFTTR